MNKTFNKIAQEDLCVTIGAHKEGMVGWFARVRRYGVETKDDWTGAGHGFTVKAAVKQGYKVYKGTAKPLSSEVFERTSHLDAFNLVPS
jgi:hypothetical protein